jgi:hypothetical protein
MIAHWPLRVFRLAFGALGIVAVVEQYRVFIQRGGDPVNFFSFFTILSNIFAAGLLIHGAWSATTSRSDGGSTPSRLAYLRGAAVLYMSVTGIVYALLLAGLPNAGAMTRPWINAVLHDVMPVAMVVDWLIDPPSGRLDYRRSLAWLAFPAAYVAYSLGRGAAVNWYPYPFLSPLSQGYGGVAAQCAIILVGIVTLTWCIVALQTLRSAPRRGQRV